MPIQVNRSFSPFRASADLDPDYEDWFNLRRSSELSWDGLLKKRLAVILGEAGIGKTYEFQNKARTRPRIKPRWLASGNANAPSPRLAAIRIWAERTWVEDLEAALADGSPRKSIVFTHWVGDSRSGEAETLWRELASAFEGAISVVRSRRPKK
jgi:hypothetical protein